MVDFDRLFYTCSLIEYIGRITKNRRKYIVERIGVEGLARIYEYSDILHCERIESVADNYIKLCKIKKGKFDNVAKCRYRVPSYWDIGKVYARLIRDIGNEPIEGIVEAYNSWIADKIDDYNIAVYYMSPEYIFKSYKEGELLE